MSEEKKHRSPQEIQAEYQKLATQAGNLQYAISEQTKDLALINGQMRDLSFEFNAAKSAEAGAQ